MNQIPKRLKKEPLIETIWELRFESLGASEILPGILYSELKKQYPDLRLHRLAAADIPPPVMHLDPNLRFASKVRLESPGTSLLWQVGDRVVTINCRQPYVGWQQFKQAIEQLIRLIEASGLVPRPQRHSLRYIDLLTLDPAPNIFALKLGMNLGDYNIRNYPLQVRLELPDEECTHIVQIATPANAQLEEGRQTGTVVDLESLFNDTPSDWDTVRGQLEMLHDKSKNLFFKHILTSDAIEKLDPEY